MTAVRKSRGVYRHVDHDGNRYTTIPRGDHVTPTRQELLDKVTSIAAKGGVKVCPDCQDLGKLVEENEAGKVSYRTCPCRWETR